MKKISYFKLYLKFIINEILFKAKWFQNAIESFDLLFFCLFPLCLHLQVKKTNNNIGIFFLDTLSL